MTPTAASRARCPNCMAENPSAAHFCSACTAPLSAQAATDPIWHLWAQGHVFHKAVHGANRQIVLVGMWMIFGLSSLILAAQFAVSGTSLADTPFGPDNTWETLLTTVGTMILQAAALALNTAILYFTTRSFFRNRARKPLSESHD